MCGIAGIVGPSASLPEPIQRMTDALSHRGPDGQGHWVHDNVVLGHRRLAVVDLSQAGHQPMLSADGRWAVTYNGEVYNAAQIAAELGLKLRGRSDTEVLVESISRLGVVDTAKKLVGMFAFCAFHIQTKRLYLVRDRLGIKPLYWGWVGNELIFSSELHALSGWRDRLIIDRNAVASFLRYGYVPSPASIYQQIRKLEPATVLCLDTREGPHARVDTTTYWDIARHARQSTLAGDDRTRVEVVHKTLKQAVRDRMISDVPLGAFLSGGYDSTLVCALMQSQAMQLIKTCTIGFDNPEFDEAKYARQIAEHLGTEHTEIYVSEQDVLGTVDRLPKLLDEPFADSSLLPTYLVSHLARKKVTVALSGDGGDELFWGYQRYPTTLRTWEQIKSLPRPFRSLVRSVGLNRSVQRLMRQIPSPSLGGRKVKLNEKLRAIAELLGSADEQVLYHNMMSQFREPERMVIGGRSMVTPHNDSEHWSSEFSGYARMAWQDTVAYLPGDILTKVDRASMGVSLEARVPLLDHRVVEVAARLPGHMKVRDGQQKFALRQVLANYVPAALTDRPKMGFGVPMHEWLRGPLRSWCEDLLNQNSIKNQGLLSAEEVQTLLNDHMRGRSNNATKLWHLLILQIWLTA